MDQLLVQEFHLEKGLPMEIIQIILQYTYCPQPSNLLGDVKSYLYSLNEIKDQYFNYWHEIEPGEDLNWLENDIIRYANSNRPTILGPHLKMQDILDRSFMNLKLKGLPIYNNEIKRLQIKTMINIFWGLFTVEERQEFFLQFFLQFV